MYRIPNRVGNVEGSVGHVSSLTSVLDTRLNGTPTSRYFNFPHKIQRIWFV